MMDGSYEDWKANDQCGSVGGVALGFDVASGDVQLGWKVAVDVEFVVVAGVVAVDFGDVAVANDEAFGVEAEFGAFVVVVVGAAVGHSVVGDAAVGDVVGVTAFGVADVVGPSVVQRDEGW